MFKMFKWETERRYLTDLGTRPSSNWLVLKWTLLPSIFHMSLCTIQSLLKQLPPGRNYIKNHRILEYLILFIILSQTAWFCTLRSRRKGDPCPVPPPLLSLPHIKPLVLGQPGSRCDLAFPKRHFGNVVRASNHVSQHISLLFFLLP